MCRALTACCSLCVQAAQSDAEKLARESKQKIVDKVAGKPVERKAEAAPKDAQAAIPQIPVLEMMQDVEAAKAATMRAQVCVSVLVCVLSVSVSGCLRGGEVQACRRDCSVPCYVPRARY